MMRAILGNSDELDREGRSFYLENANPA